MQVFPFVLSGAEQRTSVTQPLLPNCHQMCSLGRERDPPVRPHTEPAAWRTWVCPGQHQQGVPLEMLGTVAGTLSANFASFPPPAQPMFSGFPTGHARTAWAPEAG